MANRWLCFLLVLVATTVFADEQVRQVQEELRKRNLYFGDIDGQTSGDLASALKRYQTRKGFAATGNIDRETATSLNVQIKPTAGDSPLPDVAVLKSDSARNLPEPRRIELENLAEQNPDATPEPPAESPPPAQDINPARITKMVQQYLRDSETSDVPGQTGYFIYPVEYFDHGSVGPAFVEKDVTNYLKRWPERKYTLTAPITFAASSRADETRVQFTIGFEVRSKNRIAKGHTRNFWTIRPEGDELKISSIREERMRE